MTDFSSATITTGSLPPGNHTLYSPQYVVTAKHVSGSDTMSFGYAKNTYTTVGTNNNSGAYQAGGRFTAFYRLGGDAVRQRQKW